METATRIAFSVFGRPQQRGSKTPWIPRHGDGSMVIKNGRPVIATMDSNKKSKGWMSQVRDAASDAFKGDLIRQPIRLSMTFFFSRPQSHMGSGRNAGIVKASAPFHHAQQPDCDKLARCLTDALKGVVLADDKQVSELIANKRWTTEQERAEVTIEILQTE